MIELKWGEIAEALGGRVVSGDAGTIVRSVATDSRLVCPGDLFFPLKGEKFDGHAYIDNAVSAGAIGFVFQRFGGQEDRRPANIGAMALEVKNTGRALADLAALVRDRSGARVVGVTGSTGKTSAKDILRSVTETSLKTLASAGNQNNEVGVPLTILKAQPETELMIIEMGMRGLGQIGDLSRTARPEIGIITNIGYSHLGLLGSQERIAEAKSELIAALPKQGYAILNHDDAWVSFLRERTQAQVATFGLQPGADFSACDIEFDADGLSSWRLVVRGCPGVRVKLSVPGRHNILNALAAAAAATVLGLDEQEIANGLSRAELSGMRLNVMVSSGGVKIVNDAYNANPASMAAALETLARIDPPARHIAVLGMMAELGAAAADAYRSLGSQAAALPIDLLLTVGDEASAIGRAAIEQGMPAVRVAACPSKERAVELLREELSPGDVVLIKGSRAAYLETVAEALVEES